jgi:hypothetical protein
MNFLILMDGQHQHDAVVSAGHPVLRTHNLVK